MKTVNNIGNRVRSLRQRAGLTQQALELAIDTSAGSLSRIESGETNPTKETLVRIAQACKLNYHERVALFGDSITQIPDDFIRNALLHNRKDMDEHMGPAYLLDYRRNVHYVNKIGHYLFDLDDQFMIEGYPNLIEYWFQSEEKYTSLMGQDNFERISHQLLSFFIQELKGTDPEWLDLVISRLRNKPSFISAMESISRNSSGISDINRFEIELNFNKHKVEFITSESILSSDPRLMIVWYNPRNRITMDLMQKLYGKVKK